MGIYKTAKNMYVNVEGTHTVIAGEIIKIADKITITATKGDLTLISNKKIIIEGKDGGVKFGEPKFEIPKDEIDESEYKLESTYIHDHLKSVATEMTGKYDVDNTSIVYKFYKEIADGNVINPNIVVSKQRLSNKLAFYHKRNEKIIVWQESLIDIEKDTDKKILLALALTEAYGDFINIELKDKLNPDNNLETYEYDLFRFDGIGDKMVTIAKMQSPNYSGNLDINFPKQETQKPIKQHHHQDKKERGGPSAGDFADYSEEEINAGNLGGPGDPIPKMVLVFKFNLDGSFSASICAGIQKNIGLGKDWGITPGFNLALTYNGYGTPGTSPLSRNLFYASASPLLTLGAKTGNTLPLNIFNQYTATGIDNSYEYSFTIGTTGVLSTGKVTSNYDKDGNRIKDPQNSHDHKNRHQIIGGTAIKVGNFMIASYNDIFKPPLFLGYNSDQYWSAGVNIQAKLTDSIKVGYAFDLYYGKSNNKNPYNLDKIIDGQNYDNQSFFDLLLNNGQETYTVEDSNGTNSNITTKFGYGTFWPSNLMHDNIKFPVAPKKPKEPIQEEYNSSVKYDKALAEYKKEMLKYEDDYKNYQLSMTMNPFATFHHLRIVYKGSSKHPSLERIKIYNDAELPKIGDIYLKSQTELLQEINDIEKKVQDDIKSKK